MAVFVETSKRIRGFVFGYQVTNPDEVVLVGIDKVDRGSRRVVVDDNLAQHDTGRADLLCERARVDAVNGGHVALFEPVTERLKPRIQWGPRERARLVT